jgi:hypothetical protein
MTGFTTHDIQTPVDSVGKIHVRAARRPEQRSVAQRGTREAVRRRFALIVRLGLDDDSPHTTYQQARANELLGN